jgi:F-box protein 11
VVVKSVPLIQKNNISQNKGSGIILLKNSLPQLIGNDIIDNDGIGLFLRDNSFGKITDNKVNIYYFYIIF